jgi:hypothetical protein
MKRIRVTYFKAASKAQIPGIGGSPGSSAYVFDGFVCGGNQGGGIVASMYKLPDGGVRVYKRDGAEKPVRSFGIIPQPGGGTRNVTGQFVDVSSHLIDAAVCVEEEVADETSTDAKSVDLPPAQPVAQQKQRDDMQARQNNQQGQPRR